MATTIQISDKLHKELMKRKLYNRETFEEVIWDMLEDTRELNEQTKEDLAQARAEIKKGKYHTLAQVKAELGK